MNLPAGDLKTTLSGIMLSFLLLSVSASVCSGEADDAPLGVEEDVEEILTQPVDEGEYTETTRCIQSGRIRQTQILDRRHIVYRMNNSEYYLVQFKHDCPMLDRNSTLIQKQHGSQLCALDTVTPVNGIGRSAFPGAPCQIPGFQSITKEQVALLKESLKLERKRKREVDKEPKPEDEKTAGEDTSE